MGSAAPVPLLIILILMLILLVVRWCIIRMENRLLFPGSRIDKYHRLRTGRFSFLATGGGLLHYTYGGHNHVYNKRRLLFLHGNAGSLDLYAEVFEYIESCGYDVYALEYPGYGICKPLDEGKPYKHLSCVLMDNLFEAWSLMGQDSAVVVGFSLGGGLLGMTYNALIPTPAQLVFINTFSDLPKLVEENTPLGIGPWISPLMQTQWKLQHPLPKIQCHIVIISTRDDSLIPRSHSRYMYEVFKHLNPVDIVLPDGGHPLSLMRYPDMCFRSLLPSIVIR